LGGGATHLAQPSNAMGRTINGVRAANQWEVLLMDNVHLLRVAS
jgi:hypothetical protein